MTRQWAIGIGLGLAAVIALGAFVWWAVHLPTLEMLGVMWLVLAFASGPVPFIVLVIMVIATGVFIGRRMAEPVERSETR